MTAGETRFASSLAIFNRWLQEDKPGAVIALEMQGKGNLTKRGVCLTCKQPCWVWYPHTTSNCCDAQVFFDESFGLMLEDKA